MKEFNSIKHQQPEDERPKVTATRQELLGVGTMVIGIVLAIFLRPDIGVVLAIIGFALLLYASRYRFK